jgi:hypothetical protein
MVLSGATMFRRYAIQDNDIQRTTFSLLTHKNFLYVAANKKRKIVYILLSVILHCHSHSVILHKVILLMWHFLVVIL